VGFTVQTYIYIVHTHRYISSVWALLRFAPVKAEEKRRKRRKTRRWR